MKYALIKNGIVQNCIEADDAFIATFQHNCDAVVASDAANVGWTYDGTGFHAPADVTAAVPALPWTKKEFLLKFTPEEYAAIIAATKVNALLDYYWQLFMVAENVLKTDPATISGINALESNGLLAAGRAAEVLV